MAILLPFVNTWGPFISFPHGPLSFSSLILLSHFYLLFLNSIKLTGLQKMKIVLATHMRLANTTKLWILHLLCNAVAEKPDYYFTPWIPTSNQWKELNLLRYSNTSTFISSFSCFQLQPHFKFHPCTFLFRSILYNLPQHSSVFLCLFFLYFCLFRYHTHSHVLDHLFTFFTGQNKFAS